MPRYRVPFKCYVFIDVVVWAKDEEEAIDEAWKVNGLGSYVGNGGNDKLVGTRESNVSVFPSDEVEEDGDPELINGD